MRVCCAFISVASSFFSTELFCLNMAIRYLDSVERSVFFQRFDVDGSLAKYLSSVRCSRNEILWEFHPLSLFRQRYVKVLEQTTFVKLMKSRIVMFRFCLLK